MVTEPIEIGRVRALAVFTYQMSAMTGVGVRLVNIMKTLADDAPAPYDEFCQWVPERWKQDSSLHLAALMEERPELFPEFYTKTVKCGEIAGAIEASYENLGDLLNKSLGIWIARGCRPEWIQLLLSPASMERSLRWSELTPIEHKVVLFFFCKSLATMLASGVPLVTAGATAAEFLPIKDREYFAGGLMEALRPGGRLSLFLEEVGFAPPFLVRMVQIGEEAKEAGTGTLDAVLEKCALVYQRELEIGA